MSLIFYPKANDDVADFDVRLSVFPQLDIERGLFNFRLGAPTTMMNWVHVKNLVQAHILAADALTLEKNYVAVSSVIPSSFCFSKVALGWAVWIKASTPL